jgi:hypothetical protein
MHREARIYESLEEPEKLFNRRVEGKLILTN